MANKALKLREEWLNQYEGYNRNYRFGFRRRVINHAKRIKAESQEARWLQEIEAALDLTLVFSDEVDVTPTPTEPLMAPVWKVQLVRDPNSPASSRVRITSPHEAASLLAAYLEKLDREHFVVLLLDTRNKVLGLNTVSIGTVDSAIVSSRETFKPAFLANATAIILAHNHPSGDPYPSPEDINITRTLVEAGKMLDIEVLDHIIIGELGRSYSLKEHNQGFH